MAADTERQRQEGQTARGEEDESGGLIEGFGRLLGSDADVRVRYYLDLPGDPSVHWAVSDLAIEEGLSETYEAHLELQSDDPAADPELLLGQNAIVRVERGPMQRRLCGIITRVELGGMTKLARVAHVDVQPALCALSQQTDFRVFQNMSSVEIVDQVLGEALAPYERSHDIGQLRAEYAKREYVVQFGETTLEFVARLLGEEGIGYYFDHEGETELLVLIDQNDAYPELETMDGGPVPVVQRRGEMPDTEPLHDFVQVKEQGSTSVVVHDYNWTKPPVEIKGEARGEDEQGRDRELYHSKVNLGDFDGTAYTSDDAANQARLRKEKHDADQHEHTGSGVVTGLMPGLILELTDHPHPGLDGRYLITSVTHSGTSLDEAGERYTNEFTCIPVDVPYRPPRFDKPRIHSVQTAQVVGPSGEEIHTDEHGRIKVQFHWDRLGKRDDHSSCFLRVAQQWAGPGFGFVFLPRIGMEVLVTFLDGDPDRPLVTGCVYNGDNKPHYPLPDEKTKSVIRTASSPGSDGYNEIRFEDKKDGEEIFVHAQKDYNEVVENDHSTTVKGKQSNDVTKSHSESVGGDQTLSVTGNRTKTIEKDETVQVKGNRTETVTGDESVTVDSGSNRTVTVVSGNDTLEVDGDQTSHATGTYAVTGDTKIHLNQGATNMVFEGDNFELDAGGTIKAVHGSGSIDVAQDGSITIESGTNITIKVGGSEVAITPTGIEIKGVQVSVKGATGELVADPSGAKVSGPMVTVEGQAMTEIKGAMVKVN